MSSERGSDLALRMDGPADWLQTLTGQSEKTPGNCVREKAGRLSTLPPVVNGHGMSWRRARRPSTTPARTRSQGKRSVLDTFSQEYGWSW